MFQKLRNYFKRLRQNAHWLRGDTEYFVDLGGYATSSEMQRLPEPKPLILPTARLVYELEDKLECARQKAIGENE